MGTTAERMQIALDIREMKQSELAAKTGIGKSSIHAYLAGEYLPKQNNIYKMALALDVSESWLMGYDVPMDRQLPAQPRGSDLDLLPVVEDDVICLSENDLSGKIRSLRAQHGMTLEQVAQQVGVGRSTVRKWETGMIENMRRDKIAKLAAALHTTPGYLMGWEEAPAAEPSLSAAEESLVGKFRSLNADGQSKVISYTDDLIRAGIYKNIPESDPVSKDA